MLILQIWYYVSGFVCIQVSGENLEKFVNLCISRGIYLWSLERKGRKLTVCMGAGNFFFLRPIVHTTGCRVKIITKRGLPFYCKKLKRRKVLVLGALMFFMGLYVLSSFVWAVEVVGLTDPLEIQAVLDHAEDMGARPGVYKGHLDIDGLARGINIKLPNLAWVQVELKGTLLLIDAVPKEFPSKVGLPCHLVAVRDGIIQEVNALMGEPLVKEGEAVERGQILIEGLLGDQPVAAQGMVRAIVWHEAYGRYPRWETHRIPTGQSHRISYLHIARWQLSATNNSGEIPFSDFNREVKYKRLRIWRNLFLPVEIITVIYHEVDVVRSPLTVAEAEDKAKLEALAKVKKQLTGDATILRDEVRRIPIGDAEQVLVKVIIEAVEDIAEVRGFNPDAFNKERGQEFETVG